MSACLCFFFFPLKNIHFFFSLLAWTRQAGGGGVRRRIAVGAVNYWGAPTTGPKSHLDVHSYPVMRRDGTTVNAKFCNSARFHHQRNRTIQTYEGNLVCTAQTPVGQNAGLPGNLSGILGSAAGLCLYCGGRVPPTEYVGHNSLGNEVQWLPVPYLQDWWRESRSSLMYGTSRIVTIWDSDQRRCPATG